MTKRTGERWNCRPSCEPPSIVRRAAGAPLISPLPLRRCRSVTGKSGATAGFMSRRDGEVFKRAWRSDWGTAL
jgi:hypothetical protein